MTEHDDNIYLDHIADMASLLNGTARPGKEKFLSDPDLRDATIYRLQTLAESGQRLPVAFKNAHPEVPWDDIGKVPQSGWPWLPQRESGHYLGHHRARHP